MPESVAVPALTSFRDLIGVLTANGTLRLISRAVQKRGNEPLLFKNVGSRASIR